MTLSAHSLTLPTMEDLDVINGTDADAAHPLIIPAPLQVTQDDTSDKMEVDSVKCGAGDNLPSEEATNKSSHLESSTDLEDATDVEETVEEDDDADVDDESHLIGEANDDDEVHQDDENNDDDDDDDDDSDNEDDDVEDNDDDDDDDDDDQDCAAVSSKKGKKSISQPLLFTNGLGFSANNQSKLSTVVESVASKKEFSLHCKPDVSLFCLVCRWARRTAFNFAADVLNSNLVVAREIGFVSPFDLCTLRGWVLTRRGSATTQFNVQCKRFHECLLQAHLPEGHTALHLNGLIKSVCDQLETTVLPSGLPVTSTAKKQSSIATTRKKGLTAAQKRKNVGANADFELVHPHDQGSFMQRLTQNAKCLQIALLLMDFIFPATVPVDVAARTKLYFSMFSGCHSMRKFIELCHGLLVLFDAPTPDKSKVLKLSKHVFADNPSIPLLDFVFGQVSFSKATTLALSTKINHDIDSQFPKTSLKGCANRKKGDQLVIMRCVVLSMFLRFKGDDLETSKKASRSKPTSRLPLSDPMADASSEDSRKSTKRTAASIATHSHKLPRVEVTHPTVIDVLATSPVMLPQLTHAMPAATKDSDSAPSFESCCSDMDIRFKECRLASSNEVAPFAPRVFIEGDDYETNLCCAPSEFCLCRDLKNRHHGFICDDFGHQPSLSKSRASLDLPMAVSFASNDVSVVRPGHTIFTQAFFPTQLHVDLSLCLKFVIEHGGSNRGRDGTVASANSGHGCRIDFGCAGSGSTEIKPGVWRPSLLCGTSVFEHVSEEEAKQIKASLASVFDCIQVASDAIQLSIGQQPLYNYPPRDDVCGSVLRRFLGAKVMRNEWITLQVKCISRRDSTDRHKDKNNCIWVSHDKTGALCFMVVDALSAIWSMKFIANGRHVLGTHCDKLLGANTLCSRIKTHFEKLDLACATFLDDCDGSYKPASSELNWKNPWGFFLDDRCPWIEVKDTGKKDFVCRCILLPTTVVRDCWLSPAVHVINQIRSLGVKDRGLLELVLLGAHQTSWFRFFHVGMKMFKGKKRVDIFRTCVELAELTFGSISGGPKPRFEPPGINATAVYCGNNPNVLDKVISYLFKMLHDVNSSPEKTFNHEVLRQIVKVISDKLTTIDPPAELGEFRLMLVLQMSALSSVVLHPSPKLLNLLYPIQGKGSAKHLLSVGVQEKDHQDAIRRVSHCFNLVDFGDNGGESVLCETLTDRNVQDAFFEGQSLFLLNARGSPVEKKHSATKWTAKSQPLGNEPVETHEEEEKEEEARTKTTSNSQSVEHDPSDETPNATALDESAATVVDAFDKADETAQAAPAKEVESTAKKDVEVESTAAKEEDAKEKAEPNSDVDNAISELNNEKGPADFVRVDVPRQYYQTCPRIMIYPFEGTQLSVEGASEGLGELSKNGFAASTGDTLVNASRVPLVGVTNEDCVLLKPREWWNDTLIDFCIEW